MLGNRNRKAVAQVLCFGSAIRRQKEGLQMQILSLTLDGLLLK